MTGKRLKGYLLQPCPDCGLAHDSAGASAAACQAWNAAVRGGPEHGVVVTLWDALRAYRWNDGRPAKWST